MNTDELLSSDQVAEILGITNPTLQNWRSADKGPDYLKLGKKVWYSRYAVDLWIEAQIVTVNDHPK